MPNFLKINLKTAPQNFNKVFFNDWPFDDSVDKDDLSIFADYWKGKGIDWDYVMANPDNMGYSITNTKEDLDNFFLIPYLEDKFDELEAIVVANAEVDNYIILAEEEAKKAFTDWFNSYLNKLTLEEEVAVAAAEESANRIRPVENEIQNPEEELAEALEKL